MLYTQRVVVKVLIKAKKWVHNLVVTQKMSTFAPVKTTN